VGWVPAIQIFSNPQPVSPRSGWKKSNPDPQKKEKKKPKSGWGEVVQGGFTGWAGFCPPLIESTVSANSYSSVGLLNIVEDFNVCIGDILL
jgi:hypothetical protein